MARHLRIAALALAAAGIVAMLSGCSVVNSIFPNGEVRDGDTGQITQGGTTDVFTLKEGDCLSDDNGDDGTEVSDVPTVPCSTPHAWEVYKNVTMTEDEYPGDSSASDEAETQCEGDAFTSFVGVDYNSSTLDVTEYYPTDDSWSNGDRVINCLVGDPDGTTVGSLQSVAK
jgi:hypothetical protein